MYMYEEDEKIGMCNVQQLLVICIYPNLRYIKHYQFASDESISVELITGKHLDFVIII